MIDINEFDTINIGLASSKQIRSWSHGEVIKPETINYRTLKPEKDGLFCERIFGPTKDWECYCGKYKRVRYKGIVCERCGVEVTRSKVRRERMGHIDLAAPVSHIWFFKGVPSRIGYLLDMAPKDLEKVLYFAASIVTFIDEEARSKDLPKLEKEVQKYVDGLESEKQQMVQEIEESLARRVEYYETGKQTDFSPDDHLWAENLETSPKRMKAEDREKAIRDIRKNLESDITDTEAYMDSSIDRMNRTWELFTEMQVRDIVPDESLFRELRERFGSPYGFGEYFRGGMGAEAVRDLLDQVDLEAEAEKLDIEVKTAKGQKQARSVKRLKVVSAFLNSENKPTDMILEAVPVIAPELRPMVQLDGGRFATSDLNDLYRRVINRNNRLKRLLDLGAPEIIVNNEKRMLQEAVDALFDNGRRGRPVTGPGNRALKSLSDMLKGKQGRFRQNLLGKRVDYSGRSVIVAGPYLRLHQCGLPKIMALELFKPFIMARLVERKVVQNIKAAKKMVESGVPEVWDVLEEVIHEHPVLLNRAPTLHRLGIQAFEPKLVEGKAIQVHPLVCHAFNADFDGDQMAVHLPLSAEAQAEARLLMLSSNNILSPATGQPLATPSQDMVLGTYYLTYGPTPEELETLEEQIKSGKSKERPHVYRSAQEAELSYEHNVVRLQDLAEYRRPGTDDHVLTTVGRIIFNETIERSLEETLGADFDPKDYEFVNQSMRKKDINAVIGKLIHAHGASAIAIVLDAFKDLGFKYATRAGITVSKNDIVVPKDKGEILEKFDGQVAEIRDQYDMGLISQSERHDLIVDQWTQATEEVGQAMEDNLDELNPIFMMANSGARGSFKQIRQLAGMRGLMANPKGEIIERPIKANFVEGLTVQEYFISTHGARKGLADTALRTADSGYLTRRLVDVSQDVIIRENDCKTKDDVEVEIWRDGKINDIIVGRYPSGDWATKRGRVICGKNEMITVEHLADAEETFADEPDAVVNLRSVLKCKAATGICQKCFGASLATGQLAEIGDAVGIIAAQSIGEPGTQLTMRTFHTGGIAGADITHGLPRIVELFEARKPKGLAVLAEQDGKVTIEDSEKSEFFQYRVFEVPKNRFGGAGHGYVLDMTARGLREYGIL
ncbi:MAG: DNA-directed RNA polymerase subunit beta' [Solirubrobacterales bacterium]